MAIDISDRDLEDIEETLLDEDLPNKFRRKLLTLKMRHSGIPLEMIASTLTITVRSVSNYLSEYREGGLEACLEDRAYAPLSSVEQHLVKSSRSRSRSLQWARRVRRVAE